MKDLHLIGEEKLNIVYHVPSSQFFEVTDNIYNRIKNMKEENEDNPESKKIKAFFDGQPHMKEEEIRQSKRLTKVSFLSTQKCNLRCKYCFANYGHYTENEDSVMSIETYKNTLNYLLEKYPSGIYLIQFFGGEPLIGFNEIKEFIPYCLEEMKKRGLKKPSFGIVTNGTIFTEEMILLFNEYNVSITISLDGPNKELNDVTRISAGGWSVIEKIKENMEWINKKRKFPLFAEITMNKQHLLRYEPGKASRWMEEIQGMGFDGGVFGVVESEDGLLELLDEDKEKYQMMYREIVDYWFSQMTGEDGFCNFDILRAINNISSGTLVALPCGAGLNTLTVTASGDILPCYVFYGVHGFEMGNVINQNEELYNSVRDIFVDVDKHRPEECRSCWLGNVCGIWCRGFSYKTHGSMSSVSKPRCWTAEALTEGVLVNLLKLKKQPERYKEFVRYANRATKLYKGEK